MKRSVLKQLHKRRGDVLVASCVGGDYGALALDEENAVVLAAEPVTCTFTLPSTVSAGAPVCNAGDAIIAACNNVACAGATPSAVTVTLLLPTSANEEDLRSIMKSLDAACETCRVDIVNGHTEVARAVQEVVVTVTAMGTVRKNEMLHSKNIQPGMDIIATKWIGLEGTAQLACRREAELRSRYSQPFIDNAKVFGQMMSIIPEAAVAARSGAGALHDVSEGGIFGALWEFAESGGVGLEIDVKRIPIRQETVEICEFFDENPYKIVSGGCLLIAAVDGNAIVRELEKEGIPAVVIGKATDSNDRVLLNEDERRFLERN